MDVVIAVITAKGEIKMTELIVEAATAPASAASEQPKAAKKARVAPKGAHVAPKKGKSAKKATPAKKAPKGNKKTKSAREGSKTDKILELLKRKDGATVAEIMKATDWQAPRVRGFINGTLGKKMGLTVISTKGENGERSYLIKA